MSNVQGHGHSVKPILASDKIHAVDVHIIHHYRICKPRILLTEGNFGQETKHVKIGHVKIDRAHFRAHFREHWKIAREHWKISREHSRGSLRGDPLVRFTQTKPQPLGISVDMFVYTTVCILVSTFVREFRGSNFAVRVLCACLKLAIQDSELLQQSCYIRRPRRGLRTSGPPEPRSAPHVSPFGPQSFFSPVGVHPNQFSRNWRPERSPWPGPSRLFPVQRSWRHSSSIPRLCNLCPAGETKKKERKKKKTAPHTRMRGSTRPPSCLYLGRCFWLPFSN